MLATKGDGRWVLSVDVEELGLIEEALYVAWRLDREDLAADYTDEFDKAELRKSIDKLEGMLRTVKSLEV